MAAVGALPAPAMTRQPCAGSRVYGVNCQTMTAKTCEKCGVHVCGSCKHVFRGHRVCRGCRDELRFETYPHTDLSGPLHKIVREALWTVNAASAAGDPCFHPTIESAQRCAGFLTGECGGVNPLVLIQRDLRRGLIWVNKLLTHECDWGASGVCVVCGANGNA